MRKQKRVLVNQSDTTPAWQNLDAARRVEQRLPVDFDASAGWPHKPGNQVNQRRFAGAGRTEEAD
jgi:hypothetical protein